MLIIKTAKSNKPGKVFLELVNKKFGTKFTLNQVQLVYDYVHQHLGKNVVFYISIDNPEKLTYRRRDFAWFDIKRISKLNMEEQTRHDIVIGTRVIRAIFEGNNP